MRGHINIKSYKGATYLNKFSIIVSTSLNHGSTSCHYRLVNMGSLATPIIQSYLEPFSSYTNIIFLADLDFILPENNVTFPIFAVVRRCLSIAIVQDDILEGLEFFTVSITSSDSSITEPAPIPVLLIDSNSELCSARREIKGNLSVKDI